MKVKMVKYLSTDSQTNVLLNQLSQRIARKKRYDPHPGLILCSHDFSDPYPLVNDIDLLCLATMDLLLEFAYPSLSGYGKFTICYTMKRSYGEVFTFTIGSSIPLTNSENERIPLSEVLAHISHLMKKYAEIYDGDCVLGLMLRVYIDGEKMGGSVLPSEERACILSSLIHAGKGDMVPNPITARRIQNRKRRSYPNHITALKPPRCTELKPFLVADIETLLIENEHYPYAAGFMLVRPGEILNSLMIDTYFSEDFIYSDINTFESRSTLVLKNLVNRIETLVRQNKSARTIYFHNFSRFDGIFLLKHLSCHHMSYKLKPLIRNHMLYEIVVYSGSQLLFRFRDSLNLLPGKLSSLAKNLCPDLGDKGSIDYEKVNKSNLLSMKNNLIEYMKQDILLLGGVMQKAQSIYWNG